MNQETWRAVVPQYSNFDDAINQFPNLPFVDFIELQPRLNRTLSTFVSLTRFNPLLVINSPDNVFYRSLMVELLRNRTDMAVEKTESINMTSLLGSYTADELGNITVSTQGLLEKANNGYIVISVNLLLANPASWQHLKAALMGDYVSPVNSNPARQAKEIPSNRYNVKLIVMGDRSQIADLEYVEPDLYHNLALYTEIEQDLLLDETTIEQYLGYLRWITDTYKLPTLTSKAIHRLMIAGARFTEDQGYMPADIQWYLSIFEESALSVENNQFTYEDFDQTIANRYYRQAYLPQRALSDILNGQVIIETDGECVGQVNGLTVVDVAGHPESYGEPARISCVIHFGDGDISDVERKAELGGNLHAKGMMIMQAFVSSALQLDEPLPYSASVVFEQSYSEVDGDSATLAELCSFVSALSEYPINQQIAVTGAVDQLGRVQAVGGLNEKIEGFYHVCKHQGLTGSQGVILPKSNLKHLALHTDVVESIQAGEFHIWSVETVDEAIPIIMGKPFRGDDETSVISKIAERIENFERHEHPQGIVERIKNWFV
ncbi:Lon protease family protein [Vibrio sinensis]|uniref:endopeptidase La n=1 Tax=Vibrio sinensis TaxID=2302434 RepID=A0A3A6QQD5_9VIBR|nr:Lon protease family protein [Vibrio sinensis]RJX72816.1 Lon protease family protein [Vibrio sinensis]